MARARMRGKRGEKWKSWSCGGDRRLSPSIHPSAIWPPVVASQSSRARGAYAAGWHHSLPDTASAHTYARHGITKPGAAGAWSNKLQLCTYLVPRRSRSECQSYMHVIATDPAQRSSQLKQGLGRTGPQLLHQLHDDCYWPEMVVAPNNDF